MSDRGRGQNQGRGRGQHRGRGRGQTQGHGASGKDIELLKKNLQETIKNTETLLNELGLDKRNKHQKQPGGKKDGRGSKSLMDLSSGSMDSSNRGKTPPLSRGHSRGRGGRGGRGGPNVQAPNHHRGANAGYQQSRPPPLLSNPPLYSPPGMNFPLHAQPPPYGSIHSSGNIPPLMPDGYGSMGFGGINHGNLPTPAPSHFKNGPPKPHAPNAMYGNVPPPPTYDESMQDSKKKESNITHKRPGKEQDSQQKLNGETLVKTLAIFRGQFEKAETIGRHLEKDPNAVVNFAKSRKDLFAIMGEGKDAMIELVPKISLCSDYFSESSCDSRESCKKLHICKTYVTGYCNVGGICQYGHRWDTNHNSGILSKLYLDLIDKKTLHQIMRKLCKDNSELEICYSYNNDRGCRYDTCRRLHICKSYVLSAGKCSNKDCSFNHNIVDKQCSNLLKASGVAMNEAPRDILLHLVSLLSKQSGTPVVQSDCKERKAEEKGKGDNREKSQKASAKIDGSSDDGSDSELSDDMEGQSKQKKKGSKERKSKNKVKTCKSTDVLGDVIIPEICVFSLDDKCMNAKMGCKYLHAKSLFHWQVEKNGKWYNLRIFQSKKLEGAYRDIATDTVEVPALDQDKLEDFAKELLKILGTKSLKADFQAMTITNKDTNLKLRRVSTQSSVLFSHPKATVFEWYFKDDQGKWIQYGQVDSDGNQHLVCNIGSEDIEKQYMSDPSSTMLICNPQYKYKLDFSRMAQVNMLTDKERDIRRRPARLSYQKKSTTEEDPSSALPTNWSQMFANQTHLLVPLDSKSAEYLEVSSRLRLTLPTANIQKIERLQNPYLWRLLQYKKANLSRRYDDNQLNMQKLFHGICPEDIDTVCKENFDWRQGTTVEQNYGKGTYFSNSAAVARRHCTPDEFGRVHMFLAQVIIGMVVKGDPSYTRPPGNPSTGSLYDTTVDDITAPTVFVKYDKEEYYPEYVIEFF